MLGAHNAAGGIAGCLVPGRHGNVTLASALSDLSRSSGFRRLECVFSSTLTVGMPAHKYKVFGIGSPLNDGASQSFHVAVAAIAKKANANQPNVVINELVCATLAKALFLPCPPGVVLEDGGETFFSSLNFNMAGQALPPAPVPEVVAAHPELCWGITLFDVLVMNGDRHARNLSYNRQTKDTQIFDHSHAFLRVNGTVDGVIANFTGKPAIENHCIKGELNTWNGFSAWSARVKSLPDYMMDETMEAACRVGLPADKKGTISQFMKQRRDSIDHLVTNHVAEFPKLPAKA
jgi:hypothetical protein